MIDPTKDGIDHINIYSKAKTELGRFLTNFAHTPIDNKFGHFESIEGLWYWLGTRNDKLRNLYGFLAKKLGRESETITLLPTEEFKSIIKEAIKQKLDNNPIMKTKFIESSLPFKHYYAYGTKVVNAGFDWIPEYFEELRRKLND